MDIHAISFSRVVKIPQHVSGLPVFSLKFHGSSDQEQLTRGSEVPTSVTGTPPNPLPRATRRAHAHGSLV